VSGKSARCELGTGWALFQRTQETKGNCSSPAADTYAPNVGVRPRWMSTPDVGSRTLANGSLLFAAEVSRDSSQPTPTFPCRSCNGRLPGMSVKTMS
jgi:hypothetical protein